MRQMKNCAPALSGLSGTQHGGDRAAEMLALVGFALQPVQAAGAVERGLGGILRERIAALDDAHGHGAMEHGAVVGAGLGLIQHVADMIGAAAASSWMTMVPSVVSSTTCLFWRASVLRVV